MSVSRPTSSESRICSNTSAKSTSPLYSHRGIDMPDGLLPKSKGNKRCLTVTASIFLVLALTVACIVDSYHKINEGYVGIYFRHGAIQDRVSEPGVHLMRPFIDDYKEVKIRPETHLMDPVKAITKDGIQNTFREINVITTVTKDQLIFMAKKFGVDFKQSLIFDRIKEDLRFVSKHRIFLCLPIICRIFCANHTIDEVYNTMFLDIVKHVKENVARSISRLGQDGIEILNLVIPKQEIPADIVKIYQQVKVQWTEQLVATQQQKTERIKKETQLIKVAIC